MSAGVEEARPVVWASVRMLPKRRTIRFEKLLDEMRQRDPQRQEDAFFQPPLEERVGGPAQ